MRVPWSGRRKALIVVDVQPAFVIPEGEFALDNIRRLLAAVEYDLYVESLFYSDETSMWARQTDEALVPRGPQFYTLPAVRELLPAEGLVRVEKRTKSVFKGGIHIPSLLERRGVEEIHLVGYDTDDCVLVSANEAFDLGFYTYVIEECTASSSGAEMRESAIRIMRNVCLTNNSCAERVEMREVVL